MGERKRRHHETQASLDGPHLSDGYGQDYDRHDFDREASLGSDLRMAREHHGYELGDVARDLRIRQAYLQALEDGRFKDLPGAAYATGFLRSYAEHVGLDPEQVVRRFKEESSGAIPRSELYMPKPVPEGRIPGGAILLLALALAGGVYGGWYYLTSTGRDIADLVPPVPERLAAALNLTTAAPEDTIPVEAGAGPAPAAQVPAEAAPAPAPVADAPAADVPVTAQAEPAEPAVQPDAEPATGPVAQVEPAEPAEAASPDVPAPEPAPEPVATTAAAEPPAPDAAVAVPSSADAEVPVPEAQAGAQTAVPPPAAPAEPAAPPAAPPAAADQAGPSDGKVYGVVNGTSRIQLRATQDSWVQIRNDAGDLLFARVLRPGDLYRVPDDAGLRLVTGNAGGIVVVVDGVAAGPMGQTGQVMRDVALDPAKLTQQ